MSSQQSTQQSTMNSHRDFQWVAHRGIPDCYPENTLLGYQQAVAAGALFIEADLQLSAEGEALLFHDETLSRLCGVPGLLHQQRDIEHLSPCYPERFGQRFQGMPILTLSLLLEFLRQHPEVTLFLELKPLPLRIFGARKVLAQTLPLLVGVEQQVVLISYSFYVLHLAQRLGWQRVAPIVTSWQQWRQPVVDKLLPEVVFINHQQVPKGVIFTSGECRNPDLKLACFTVSSRARSRQLAAQGVSFIETDNIAAMLAQGAALD